MHNEYFCHNEPHNDAPSVSVCVCRVGVLASAPAPYDLQVIIFVGRWAAAGATRFVVARFKFSCNAGRSNQGLVQHTVLHV